MVSFDVASLFTNVPLRETIEIILSRLFPSPVSTYKGFGVADFRKLLELAVVDSFFTFDGRTFQQLDGVAMGSPLGPIFANIFMSNLEDSFLINRSPPVSPSFYCRYVDDTFATFDSEEQAGSCLDYINGWHPNVRFTMETENNNSLSFLDVSILRTNNTFVTSIFRKPTHTGLGIHFYNFNSFRFKLNALRSLISRGFKISSTYKICDEEINFLFDYFNNNGFPTKLFWKEVKHFLHSIYSPPVPTSTVPKLQFYVSLPFLGHLTKDFEKKLRAALERYYPYIHFNFIFNNSFTIGSFFSIKDKPSHLMRSGVVYMYNCPGCNLGRYIGSTSRLLLVRICSHRGVSHRTQSPLSRPDFSAIRNHSVTCKTAISED